MLKILKNPEFTTRVKVQVPIDGGHREESFIARFRALGVAETEAFNMFTTEGTTDFLRAILVGWDQVSGDQGPIPFSDAARDELLDVAFIRIAVLQAYNAALAGAKRGN